MKTLYISDLDGTLLNTNAELTPYTAGVINQLVSQGVLFSYATARASSTASAVTRNLSVEIPVIVYNGAFILNSKTGTILSSILFSKNEIAYIKEALSGNIVTLLVYAYVNGKESVSWLVGKENEGISYYLETRRGDKRLRPVDTVESLFMGDVFYVTCVGPQSEFAPINAVLRDDNRFSCIFQPELYSGVYWLEIMPRRATKANAILKLKELLCCNKIISFGDSLNDISMFEISDECYALENAVPELKNVATAIIESNNDDGVAKWLAKNCLL